MLFNSLSYGLFLPVVLVLYWFIKYKRVRSQNILLLFASYFFYGLWDWRFLLLILASSLIDYFAGLEISKSESLKRKKLFLYSSILWNLGVLFIFKYYNFFINEFTALFNLSSNDYTFSSLQIILPIGLSFYTFQTMSYSIDVYKKRIHPTHNLLNFLCFVSFFPQLVAGPIERAGNLLPQFENKRKFNLPLTKVGLRLILWGLVKKVVIADNLGIGVAMVFSNPEEYGSISLVYAAVLFSFQIYFDFSGYTDIAIGTANLFGFKLSKNFKIPYLAISITDFWKRWHITLTKWFTDYVYIPFVKSSKKITTLVRATGLLLTMLLVGLWHGANWTYILFGVFNGLLLGIERIPFFKGKGTLMKKLQTAPRIVTLIYLFFFTTISSVFFRSRDIDQALYILKNIFSFTKDNYISSLIGIDYLIFLILVIIAEIGTRRWDFPLYYLELKMSRPIRWVLYYAIIIFIIRYAETKEAFIYFQF